MTRWSNLVARLAALFATAIETEGFEVAELLAASAFQIAALGEGENALTELLDCIETGELALLEVRELEPPRQLDLAGFAREFEELIRNAPPDDDGSERCREGKQRYLPLL